VLPLTRALAVQERGPDGAHRRHAREEIRRREMGNVRPPILPPIEVHRAAEGRRAIGEAGQRGEGPRLAEGGDRAHDETLIDGNS
jgi:hypothetical protein